MIKMTKAQMKNNSRINAWLTQTPFQENARAKLVVPELTRDQVLRDYTPSFIQEQGAYFTPLEMTAIVWAEIWKDIRSGDVNKFGCNILEPCAGIGNLLNGGIKDRTFTEKTEITAYEINETSYNIGKALFPEVRWNYANPLNEVLVGYYDVVIMNPPYNVSCFIGYGIDYGETKSKKSHLAFLEMAIKALKEQGMIYAIAPCNYLETAPKMFMSWYEKQPVTAQNMGQLPGEFEYTKIQVHLWKFKKNSVTTEVKPQDVKSPDVKLHNAIVPEIFDALQRLSTTCHDMSYIKSVIKELSMSSKAAANWVKNNKTQYGECYYNGFICTDGRTFKI